MNENINIDEEYEILKTKFIEQFGRRPYIACPSGSKQQTIEAMKICFEKNEDILDQLLYPEDNENFLY